MLGSAPMIKVAIFTEGEFSSIERQPSLEAAHAFARGITFGANLYGAGGCAAYVLPEEDNEMRGSKSPNECAKADAEIVRLAAMAENPR